MNQSIPAESVSVRIYSYEKVPDPFPAKQFGKGWQDKEMVSTMYWTNVFNVVTKPI